MRVVVAGDLTSMQNTVVLLSGDASGEEWIVRLRRLAPSRCCTTWPEFDAAVRGGPVHLVVVASDIAGAVQTRPVLAGFRAAHPGLCLAIAHTGTAAELDLLAELARLNLGLNYAPPDGGVLPFLLDQSRMQGQAPGPSAGELLVSEIADWARGGASRALALHAALSPSGRWALDAVARACGVSLRTAQDQFRSAGLTAKPIWESCLAFHGAALLEAYPGRAAEVAAALGVQRRRLRLLIRRAFGRSASEVVTLPAAERVALLRARLEGASLRPLRPAEVRFRVPSHVGAVVGEDRTGISDRRTGRRHVLVGVAAQVWPLVLQGGSVAEITAWIARRRRLSRPEAFAEVNAAIARLIELELIEFASNTQHSDAKPD